MMLPTAWNPQQMQSGKGGAVGASRPAGNQLWGLQRPTPQAFATPQLREDGNMFASANTGNYFLPEAKITLPSPNVRALQTPQLYTQPPSVAPVAPPKPKMPPTQQELWNLKRGGGFGRVFTTN